MTLTKSIRERHDPVPAYFLCLLLAGCSITTPDYNVRLAWMSDAGREGPDTEMVLGLGALTVAGCTGQWVPVAAFGAKAAVDNLTTKTL